jgi:hypothetical protein
MPGLRALAAIIRGRRARQTTAPAGPGRELETWPPGSNDPAQAVAFRQADLDAVLHRQGHDPVWRRAHRYQYRVTCRSCSGWASVTPEETEFGLTLQVPGDVSSVLPCPAVQSRTGRRRR